jgi:hypothetical protein
MEIAVNHANVIVFLVLAALLV